MTLANNTTTNYNLPIQNNSFMKYKQRLSNIEISSNPKTEYHNSYLKNLIEYSNSYLNNLKEKNLKEEIENFSINYAKYTDEEINAIYKENLLKIKELEEENIKNDLLYLYYAYNAIIACAEGMILAKINDIITIEDIITFGKECADDIKRLI